MMRRKRSRMRSVIVSTLVLSMLSWPVPGLSQTPLDEDRDALLTPKSESGPYDKTLRRGDKAPNHGVLVPFDMYRYYRAETLRAASLDEKINEMAMVALDRRGYSWVEVVGFSLLTGVFLYCGGRGSAGKPCL
jgi:hypothetical protein